MANIKPTYICRVCHKEISKIPYGIQLFFCSEKHMRLFDRWIEEKTGDD
jgi:hypothetical protein